MSEKGLTDVPTGTFLDEPPEVHALVHGFWNGYFDEGREPEYDDSEAEPHYFRAGYLLGYAVRRWDDDSAE